MKDMRSSWVTFAVYTLNNNTQVVAEASDRAGLGTMERHYLAAPNTHTTSNEVPDGITNLRDES
jgi:hypothetical protein